MTCIVGLVEKGKVFIGGDSCGAEKSGDRSVRKDTKVFKVDEFVMGYTSSFRMGQLIRFKFKPPKPPKDGKKLYKYMVTEFVDALRKCLRAGGYAKMKDEEESGGTFLVGIRNRLFVIEDDYQVGEQAALYDSVGCGRSYALGSLESTRGDTPIRRLVQALACASMYHGSVMPPYAIESTGKEKRYETDI